MTAADRSALPSPAVLDRAVTYLATTRRVLPVNVDGRVRTLDELPPTEHGIWGGETVFVRGVQYGRCHGGPWFEESHTCRFTWGDFACEKAAHGADEKHSLVWANAEDDIDPRLS